ncbi:selenocysteine-specific translation elongation factor [uncultured Marinobacter sp.]|uniref:selenocysteine-specific translation elongation factor n=1 Tax=uncultured Marinobacter sp. TaxID=187379 RepID=UPI0030DC890F
MIIATAGHVDHGKTTLIRALTGQDTDRLAEEKRRGLTIDLGFAWMRSAAGHWLGFVDVPGHEKFIRNMVAGVAAVDAVMLVVAADDGPMPQTREHLAILQLLGVTEGVVVLTRTDRVNAGRVEEVRHELAEMLAGTGLCEAPVFPVSGLTGEGVPALLAWLGASAEDHAGHSVTSADAQPAAGQRLLVDRSFSVKGSGCVVTGTLIAGVLAVDDRLLVSPAGLPARVRGLQVHGESVAQVQAGQRCAVNLAGEVGSDRVHRGDWLVAPWLHQATDRLEVALTLLPDMRLHRGTFQVHLGAAVRSARAVVLSPATDRDCGLVQLLLEQPVQSCMGDRLILRDPALNQTIGGGRVVDPFGVGRGRSGGRRLELLRVLSATDDPQRRLEACLQAHPEGLALERFARAGNLPGQRLDQLTKSLNLVVLQASAGELAMAPDRWEQLQTELLKRLDQWHRDYPDRIGPSEPELTRLPAVLLDQVVSHRLLQTLLDSGAIARNGFRFHRPGHQPQLADSDKELLDQVLAQLEGSGLKPPIVGELAEALDLPREQMQLFLERMHTLGRLIAVAPNRFYRPETVAELASVAVALAEASPTGAFDARTYRDASGIGRRLTVSVLEYLDRAGVTAFINEERRLQPAYRQQTSATFSNRSKKGYTAAS